MFLNTLIYSEKGYVFYFNVKNYCTKYIFDRYFQISPIMRRGEYLCWRDFWTIFDWCGQIYYGL